MSAHATVKSHTTATHAAIDAAYSRFNLGDQESYIGFLQSHARVLPAIEAALAEGLHLPPWRPRTALLAQDLNAFGKCLPRPLAHITASGPAEQFGLLYVAEGSRLGNRLLMRRVGLGFPSKYLSSVHEPGEWRAFTNALDELANVEDSAWLNSFLVGASRGFQLYATAATEVSNSDECGNVA